MSEDREHERDISSAEHAATERAPVVAHDDTQHASIVGSDEEIARLMRNKSRRSFLVMGVGAVAGVAGWKWLQTRPDVDELPASLRRAHQFNERLAESYFKDTRLAPTFAREAAQEPRVNGEEGLSDGFDPATWRLQVIGVAEPTKYPQFVKDVAYETASDNSSGAPDDGADNADEDDSEQDTSNPKDSSGAEADNTAGADGNDATAAAGVPEAGLLLTLADIKRLPRVEMTTELKCIEGWSVIVHWAGARLSDFAATYQPPTRNGASPDVRQRPQDLVRYVGLETPDEGYYVGLDMASALHPQTLLCYEMNGQPLTLAHGAPLRLVTPVKYGIKHIKRIGRISFTDERPADFWAERGYDWYSGH